jgi:hypothetical protein
MGENMADDASRSDLALTLYQAEAGNVELRIDAAMDTVWATQADMAALFAVDRSVITKHLSKVFEEGEVERESNVQKMHIANSDRPVQVYNLDVVISVGYRVNSVAATRFRQWATATLKTYVTAGFVLHPEKLASTPEALDRLASEVRSIRLSEANAYQKVRDIFKASSSDYDSQSKAARAFFALVQDKFHYAITGKTAAQIILERADSKTPNMGLRSTHGKIPTNDEVKIAKNYLNESELRFLENICEQWMLFCESAAMRGKRMTMEELATRVNMMLMANEYPVLYEYPASGVSDRRKADTHAMTQLRRFKFIARGQSRRLPGKRD